MANLGACARFHGEAIDTIARIERYYESMKAKAKTSPQFERFNALVGKVLSVPKAVLDQRVEEYEKRSKIKSKKRVPKTTQKPA